MIEITAHDRSDHDGSVWFWRDGKFVASVESDQAPKLVALLCELGAEVVDASTGARYSRSSKDEG